MLYCQLLRMISLTLFSFIVCVLSVPSLSLFLFSIPSLCSLLFFSLSHRRYRGHVDAAEQGGGEEDDEEEDYEDEEEAALAREERRLLRRLDAGLYTLQRIVLVMASILVQSGKVRPFVHGESGVLCVCCVCVFVFVLWNNRI